MEIEAMARTVEITLYKLDELEPHIQDSVIAGWRNNDTFHWADEWRESLNAFESRAPLKVRDWEIGYPGTSISFYMEDEDVADLEGAAAYEWLKAEGWIDLAAKGDCPFTGYCGDETLLDAIRTATSVIPSSCPSIRSIFTDCLNDWAKAFEADLDYWCSEAAIREDIEMNDYEFHANGTLAR